MDDRLTTKLYSRLSRKFELLTEVIPVGPLRVQFTRVKDPQKVLDDICRRIDLHEKKTGERVKGDELGLPYWAELWDSAQGVGQRLVRLGLPRGASVLDLGCGLGLTGTVAAMLGAEVMLADIETDCLLFAALNAGQYSEMIRPRKVNWQTDDLGEKFQLIIGSDVLYDRSQWVFLEPFFRKHLKDDGVVLLAEPGRQTGDLFVPWIVEQGWQLKQLEEPVVTRARPIRLFEIRFPR